MSKRRTQELLDETPPHDLQAEENVIGSLLLDPALCDTIARLLASGDFYSDANQRLFHHILEIHASGRTVDTTLLVESLRSEHDLEAAGGLARLIEISRSVPVSYNAKHYANIVADRSTRRAGGIVTTEALQATFDPTRPIKQTLESTIRQLEEIAARGERGQLTRDGGIDEALEQVERSQLGGRKPGVPTGIVTFDQDYGGFAQGDLAVIAARTGVGKSFLGLQIAMHSAWQYAPVLLVSTEMPKRQVRLRALCSMAGVDSTKVRKGRMTPDDLAAIRDAAPVLRELPLFVADEPMTVADVKRAAAQMLREDGLALVVIDYLGQLEPADRRARRYEQVTQISNDLRAMAKSLNVPVLALVQLSRDADKQRDQRPRLSHLRESGAIEQDAGVVWLCDRPELYSTDADARNVLNVSIAKHREVPGGDFRLTWNSQRGRFEDEFAAADEFLQRELFAGETASAAK